LLGAVDTELEIIRIEGAKPPKGILHISKQKDGEDGQRIGFKMVEVTTGSSGIVDFEGASSLAVMPDKEIDTTIKPKAKTAPPDRTLAGHAQTLFDSLHIAIRKFGEMQVVDGMRNKCVKLDQWKDEFHKKVGHGMSEETFTRTFDRVKLKLDAAKKVVINDKLVWAVFQEKDDHKDNIISLNK
jgi:isopropylmalate/homocitrate/citramalate synthase